MKNLITSLFLIGILLSASFGLVMMNHTDGMGHSQCPFEAVGVTDCAQVQNPLDFMVSHLNAIARFFSAAPVDSFMISLALLLILAFSILIGFNKKLESLTLWAVFAKSHIRESFVSPNRILFNRWFALHENSPAFLVGRW